MSDYNEDFPPNFCETVIQSNQQNFNLLLKGFCAENLKDFDPAIEGDHALGKRYCYWAKGVHAEVEVCQINESNLRIRFSQDRYLDTPQKLFARAIGNWLIDTFSANEKKLLASVDLLENKLKQLPDGKRGTMLPEINNISRKVVRVHLSNFTVEVKNNSDAPFSLSTTEEKNGKFTVIKHLLGTGHEDALTWGAGYTEKSIFPTDKNTLIYHVNKILNRAQEKYRYIKVRMGNDQYCYIGLLPPRQTTEDIATQIVVEWISTTKCDEYGNPIFEYFYTEDGLYSFLGGTKAILVNIEPLRVNESIMSARSYIEAATPIFDALWSELRKLFCADCPPDNHSQLSENQPTPPHLDLIKSKQLPPQTNSKELSPAPNLVDEKQLPSIDLEDKAEFLTVLDSIQRTCNVAKLLTSQWNNDINKGVFKAEMALVDTLKIFAYDCCILSIYVTGDNLLDLYEEKAIVRKLSSNFESDGIDINEVKAAFCVLVKTINDSLKKLFPKADSLTSLAVSVLQPKADIELNQLTTEKSELDYSQAEATLRNEASHTDNFAAKRRLAQLMLHKENPTLITKGNYRAIIGALARQNPPLQASPPDIRDDLKFLSKNFDIKSERPKRGKHAK